MSRYLIDEIEGKGNIRILEGAQVVDAAGEAAGSRR